MTALKELERFSDPWTRCPNCRLKCHAADTGTSFTEAVGTMKSGTVVFNKKYYDTEEFKELKCCPEHLHKTEDVLKGIFTPQRMNATICTEERKVTDALFTNLTWNNVQGTVRIFNHVG